MEEIWTSEYRVMAHHTGYNGRARLKTCLDFAQDSAGNHAAHLGVGFDDLQTKGCFWALSRMAVQVEAFPHWNDRVYIETWPSGFDRLFAYRVIHLKDQNRKTLMLINTAWLIMNIEKRRFMPVKPLVENLPALGDRDFSLPAVNKLKADEEVNLNRTYSPIYSDLDSNVHVNNTAYLGWIEDSYDLDWHTKWGVKSLEVNYLQEAFAGKALNLSRNEAEVLNHHWEIEDQESNQTLCRVQLTWS